MEHTNLKSLLSRLSKRGIHLRVADGRVKVRGFGLCSDEERSTLRENRDAILALLSESDLDDVAPVSRPKHEEAETDRYPTRRDWKKVAALRQDFARYFGFNGSPLRSRYDPGRSFEDFERNRGLR